MSTTNFKKTYKFAAYTSTAITIVMTVLMTVFFYIQGNINYLYLLLFLVICYVFSFFVIQFRVERFIYKRVKKIYDDVALLDASSFVPGRITTDMETLTKEVERFAQDKKL